MLNPIELSRTTAIENIKEVMEITKIIMNQAVEALTKLSLGGKLTAEEAEEYQRRVVKLKQIVNTIHDFKSVSPTAPIELKSLEEKETEKVIEKEKESAEAEESTSFDSDASLTNQATDTENVSPKKEDDSLESQHEVKRQKVETGNGKICRKLNKTKLKRLIKRAAKRGDEEIKQRSQARLEEIIKQEENRKYNNYQNGRIGSTYHNNYTNTYQQQNQNTNNNNNNSSWYGNQNNSKGYKGSNDERYGNYRGWWPRHYPQNNKTSNTYVKKIVKSQAHPPVLRQQNQINNGNKWKVINRESVPSQKFDQNINNTQMQLFNSAMMQNQIQSNQFMANQHEQISESANYLQPQVQDFQPMPVQYQTRPQEINSCINYNQQGIGPQQGAMQQEYNQQQIPVLHYPNPMPPQNYQQVTFQNNQQQIPIQNHLPARLTYSRTPN